MSPFFFMLALFGLLHLPRTRRWPGGPEPWQKAAGAMGVALVLAGVMHFIRPDLFLPMVPSFLPAPEVIVFVSGLAELAVGIGLLLPRWRRAAGWAAAFLFVAIWPGSIYIAISGNYPPAFTQSPLYHWMRIPFHALYVAWGVWIGLGRLPWPMRRASERRIAAGA